MGGNGTEIDCFEIKGSNPSNHFMTIHKWENGVNNQTSFNYSGVDFSQDFHIFSAAWDPFFITFLVDNIQVWKINRYFTLDGTPVMWCDVAPGVYLVLPTFPSGENNYVSIIANLAIGGWAGTVGSNVSFPKQLEIDYIRVFQRNPQPGFSDLCLQNNIVGSQIICNTGQYSFSFSGPNQYVSSWIVSSNLTIISSTPTGVIVKATNSLTNGSGWIQAIFSPTQPCSNSVTKTIWIGKPIPVITGPLSLRKGSQRIYSIENPSTQSISNYQWEAEPGLTSIGSTTSSTFKVKGISCPDGSLTCNVTNVCGSGTADCFVDIICVQDLTISIFPNPVSDILTIKVDNQNIESLNIDLELSIFNENQKLVFNNNSKDMLNQFDLTFLPIGDYILRIKLNNEVQQSHLLIRR